MKLINFSTQHSVKTLIIGVHSPFNVAKDVNSYFDEFVQLVRSNDIKYEHELFIRLRQIDPGTFFTKGKLDEIAKLCADEGIEEVIISEPLSSKQERNLNALLQARVYDRTKLILEIFEKGATTAEGKIQVQLAMLQYNKTRLSGHGIHLSQQAGGIGTRGPGQTQKELELQHLEHIEHRLKRELTHLGQVRDTQRKKRLGSNIPLVCLIGYTNAGKSSIFNALTKSSVLAENRLFATLETTTRELYIDSKKKALLSDTVGFIQKLPHHLIEAFKATLDELQYAHLLLQVIDVSDSSWESHITVVKQVLTDLGVNKPMLYVFNKIDKIDPIVLATYPFQRYEPHVTTSTYTENGLEPLIDYLRHWQESNQA